MSATTETTFCNYALAKLGGGLNPDFTISSIAGDSETEALCERLYDKIRQLVLLRAWWQSATKYGDLGDDIKDTEIDISSIAVGADPFPVTVTTDAIHGKSTGDTIYLLDVEGTGGVEGLNGIAYVITVVNTTSYTLDDAIGTAAWSHTADTGVQSDVPESADWEYAFALPSDYLGKARQIDESYHSSTKPRRTWVYDIEIIQDFLFTNVYSNADDDSAYIQYIADVEDPDLFDPQLYEAFAVRFAAELSSSLIADKGNRRLELIREYENLALAVAEGVNADQQGDEEDKGEHKAITCRRP